ncbi:MAG: YkgJ family cysteine cluster protein [Pirellulales bacterium]|nr:YkgJ family cysteine cluster protein [Pirellulales bacterium]
MNKTPSDPSSGQPWYREGLAFACTGCGQCCTGDPGYVWVNQAEVEAIAAALDMDVEIFERAYVHHVGRRRSLQELPNGDCVLFDAAAARCTVYAARPRQCRSWPFWPSNIRTPDAWRRTCEDCPGAGKGPVIPLEEMEALRGLIQI